MTTHDRAAYRVMLLMLSLVVLLVPMGLTMLHGLEGSGWWRFFAVVPLCFILMFWQMFVIFKLQDQAAVEREFQRINRQSKPFNVVLR